MGRLRAPRSARERVPDREKQPTNNVSEKTARRPSPARATRGVRWRRMRRRARRAPNDRVVSAVERFPRAFARSTEARRSRASIPAGTDKRNTTRHRERSSVTKRTCVPPPSSRSENRDLVSPTPRSPALEPLDVWFVDELRTRGERASSSAASLAARDSHAFCTHIATRSGTTVCDRHGSRDCLPVPKIFLVVCRPKPKRTERPGGSSARCRVFRSL